ncbi:DUF3349 domain-containing protein [Mobilicoccus massiliensis]|uniref:DUF3349 domain-containing protein n=1 Tax=Mobilicoccus massiliensis TaxID=1522310 RepID=UPI00058C29A2|nr:DUF3349 domain-containing protein [Mobilicoccus massiliensis]
MLSHLQRVIAWLRAGYPQGIPDQDYIPLFALLRRRLSDEEARQLADELVEKGLIPPDRIDIAVGYLKLTDELPSEAELVRVTEKLRAAGWTVVDEDISGEG